MDRFLFLLDFLPPRRVNVFLALHLADLGDMKSEAFRLEDASDDVGLTSKESRPGLISRQKSTITEEEERVFLEDELHLLRRSKLGSWSKLGFLSGRLGRLSSPTKRRKLGSTSN